MMTICARCSAESPDGFRFCGACGAPLPERPPVRPTRKVVTALFCDMMGSTALGEELDPEVLRGVINRYFAEIRATIERHGGTVDKFIGDAVTGVFGIPQVREDDALRAVRAAAEIRERLPVIAREIGVAARFRTGVNTGLVLMGEGENLVVGDAVNVAARLEQVAGPGEILLGAETLRLVRDAVEVEPLEPLALKGKSEPVQAYRLLRVDPIAPGVARHLDAPLVGREHELHVLREALDRAVRERSCHLFTLLGTAGVGKSRLVGEHLSQAGDAVTVLRGRCLHHGEGITFWPLVEALMSAGEEAAGALERLEHGGAAIQQELFWEVRRLLESLAAERPVILHIDDLQWAEPTLLDLLDHIADLSRGAPILLLCTARPELLEDRPAWGGGKLNATTVLLEPLGTAESELLLQRIGGGLDPAVRARVIAAAEGNPLFLEEMVGLARDQGAVAVPSTIQALLAARLERLGFEERELLERGAVEGEVFHRLAVRALASDRLATEVELRLAGLVRKELIRPHPATLRGDEAFRFRHLLIRDAAYDGLPKSTRAELHERFAQWLEQVASELIELDEIVGWHLEQALRYRRDLGLATDPELARRAAEHLHAAGRRASVRNDVPAATTLLERALALVPEGESLQAQIAIDLAEQLAQTGDLARADELISVGERDPATAALAQLARLDWLKDAHPEGFVSAVESTLPDLLDRLTEAGDERGVAKACLTAFHRNWIASRATPAADQAWLAAEHARRAGDEGLRAHALGEYIATLGWGQANARVIARELDAIEREPLGPYLAAFVDIGRGGIARLEGRFGDCRRLTSRAIATLEDLGMRTMAAACLHYVAEAEVAAGNPAAAVAALLRSDDVLAAAGERSFRSTTQANLAQAYDLMGENDAAGAAIELAEQLGAAEDVINFAITHAVRARRALAAGDSVAAERWARSAVRYALSTDFLVVQGDSKLELGRVLAAIGRLDDARAQMHSALALYEEKGDAPDTEKARTALSELAVRA
jgi:class 3 adenylate cyclase/tetratricopeptide (TPR) repeat protein